MPVNLNKPEKWKADVQASVDMYNEWFVEFAPAAFRRTRKTATKSVIETLEKTNNLKNISPEIFLACPNVLPTLRMSMCPPLAVDRVVGLSGAKKSLVKSLEIGTLPKRMSREELVAQLGMISDILQSMVDPDFFTWLGTDATPTEKDVERAATVVADRLCGSIANPIIRNAQEARQLKCIEDWLVNRGYSKLPDGHEYDFISMPKATFSFRMNVVVDAGEQSDRQVNIPVDAVIMRKDAKPEDMALLVEAKSAGDFTNTNKRRKEEAQKYSQLKEKYGKGVEFILFLCGYFDSGYLGYEAAEGIDWVWEHRVSDLDRFDL